IDPARLGRADSIPAVAPAEAGPAAAVRVLDLGEDEFLRPHQRQMVQLSDHRRVRPRLAAQVEPVALATDPPVPRQAPQLEEQILAAHPTAPCAGGVAAENADEA